MNNKAQQEGVILVFDEHETKEGENREPIIMVRKNGSTKYYKLVEMGYQDHAEFLGADVVHKPEEK